MKIAVFVEKFYPHGSGGELATYLILKNLSDFKGLRISVFTGSENYAKIDGVSINYIPLLSGSLADSWPNIVMHQDWFLNTIKDFDVVYIPGYLYPLIDLAKSAKKKVIVHLHGYQPISITSVVYRYDPFKYSKNIITDMRRIVWYSVAQGNYKGIFRAPMASLLPLIRLWISKADVIIAVSKKQFEILSSDFPPLRNKIKVIYNLPPEICVEKNVSKHPYFIYLGGDSFIKGFPIFVKSLYMGCKRTTLTTAEFIFLNKYNQSNLNILNKVAKSCGYRIRILGRIEYEQMKKLHEKSWALIFPSHYEEPLPYAIVESMLGATIPVASKVGGVEEIIPKDFYSFLLDPLDANELLKKLEIISSLDSHTVMEFGCKLREYARKFLDPGKIKEELLKVFL